VLIYGKTRIRRTRPCCGKLLNPVQDRLRASLTVPAFQWHSELMGVTFNQKELAFLPYRVKRRSVGMPSVAPAKGESSGGSQRPRATGRSATDVTHPVPRYTVHEKAQNFVVPIPLSNGWHQEQVDELFSSLLGGAGIEGAGADREDGLVMGVVSGTGLDADSRENTEVSLSGLKVF
jgi:hypothetical protein